MSNDNIIGFPPKAVDEPAPQARKYRVVYQNGDDVGEWIGEGYMSFSAMFFGITDGPKEGHSLIFLPIVNLIACEQLDS